MRNKLATTHLCCTRLLLLLLGPLRRLLPRLLLRLLLLGLLGRLLLLHCLLLAAGLGHAVGQLVDADCIVVLPVVATKCNQHVVLWRVPVHTTPQADTQTHTHKRGD
jgi:hypothetical protein